MLLNEAFARSALVSHGAAGKAQQTDSQGVSRQTHVLPTGCPAWVPWERQCLGQEGSPPFAGDKADVISLAVRVDPPRLPPLLVTGVDDMQHIPKAEAQSLAQEATVLGLVIVKQGPGGQAAFGQSLVRTPSPRTQPGGSTPGSRDEHRCRGF